MKRELTKLANEMYSKLATQSPENFKVAFREDVNDAIKMVVREEVAMDKIIDCDVIDGNDTHLVKEKTNDRPVYRKLVEKDAIAMEVGFREIVQPYFETGIRFDTHFEKYTTGKVRKPKIELDGYSGFVEMIRDNGINQIARRVDSRFFSAALLASCHTGWNSAHSFNEDWSSTFDRADISSPKSAIISQELNPSKWAGSSALWEYFNTLDAGDIGDEAFRTLKKGFGEKELMELPFIKTIKTGLTANEKILKHTGTGTVTSSQADPSVLTGTELTTLLGLGIISVGDIFTDVNGNSSTVTAITSTQVTVDEEYSSSTLALGWTIESNGNLFRYTVGSQIWERLYCFVEQDYLGVNLQYGDYMSTTEWDSDHFEWETLVYRGFGLGDIRGISVLNVRIK